MRRLEPTDQTGKVVVVTGANSGIGLETAAALAAMGATVVMAARNPERGQAALDRIRNRTGSERVELAALDLADLGSVRDFAAGVLERHDRIDVLVNNAGLIVDRRTETAQGFETMMGVNHLGHFLLADLLRDRLIASAPSRIVVLSSVAHRYAIRGLDRSDLMAERKRFRSMSAYGRSKLANLQFALEAARRFDGSGVTVHAVHPGTIRSGFAGDGDAGVLGLLIDKVGHLVMRPPEVGARTPVMLAASMLPADAHATGGYWVRGRLHKPSRAARDREAQAWLWATSERLVAEASQR